MKSLRQVFVFAFFILCGTFAASAQVPAQTGPAKVGFVNSAQFSRTTGGVNRFVAALRVLDGEFKVRRDDIAASIARFNELQKEPAGMAEAQLATRREQAQTLQIDITRKQEDARAAYSKRFAQLTDPILKTIVDALTVYAKARGIDILIDVSKFPDGLLVVNEGADMTAAFIRDFNAKNP
jgi:Skp family chaperone for outer membrane proteins